MRKDALSEAGCKMTLDKSELQSRIFEGFADTSRRRYVCMINMQTMVSRWSQNAVDDFDLPGEYFDVAQNSWTNLIHPDDKEEYLKDLQAVFRGEKMRHDVDYRIRNREGEYVACTCRGNVVPGTDGKPNLFIASIENHSIMDNIDATTNLYNIFEFWQSMRSLKEKKHKAIVLLMCVNNFSEINDTYGYFFGNKILREVAELFRKVIGNKGTVFRMDGVQFACCLEDITQAELEDLYKQLKHEVKHHIYVNGLRMAVTISGGAVVFNTEYDEYSILTSARYALDQSKHKYHGELIFFDNALLSDNKQNLMIMTAIRDSIQDHFKGFYLYFQPIVDSENEKLIGAEALLRWKNAIFGEVSPGLFIPWIENDPSFWDLGNWILKQAMLETKEVVRDNPEFVLNVNVAYPQLAQQKFTDTVKEILIETGFPAENLCLELTERCKQLEIGFLRSMVDSLKELGIKIAIDDFGTGFSSLSLLSELPVDTLKIDRGFIRDIEVNQTNQAIVDAVTGCASKLDVHVCLEGLEDRHMIDFVKQYAVYSYQGYYFSRPIPISEFKDKYC